MPLCQLLKAKFTKRIKVMIMFVLLLATSAAAYGIYFSYIHSTHEYTLNFAGMERSYFLHIPPSYDDRMPVPLVIVLHGGYNSTAYAGEPAKDMEVITGFTLKSDAEGFIVVYAEGFEMTWNVGFGVGPAFAADVDDVGFIRELINSLQQKFAIDGNRIYVAGFSNGAIMAYRLAAELSDKIAAAAIVSGTAGGRYNSTSPLLIHVGANSTQPVSIIVFHGTSDALPYNGGFQEPPMVYYVISVNESVSLWVRHDGCSGVPRIEESGSTHLFNPYNMTISGSTYNMSEYIFGGGAKGTEVVLYKVIGVWHGWPTTATDEIWTFFESHPKNG